MSNTQIGALRGLGLVVLLAVLGFLANAANLQAFVNPTVAGLISVVALALEGALSPKGTALFGSVKS